MEQSGGDREQPMALLKLQLWGWEWGQAAPKLPWAVSQGLNACNQSLKGPVDSGLGAAELLELFRSRWRDTALRRPLEALPSPSLHSAAASAASLAC